MRHRSSLLAVAFPALVVCGMAIAGSTLSASAHSALSTSTPPDGSDLAGNPPYLSLRYNSPVIGVLVVRVSDERGQTAHLGEVEQLDGGKLVRTRLPRLPIGRYKVSWRVVSADAHESAGSLAFSVGIGSGPAASQTGAISLPQATARWIFLWGVLLAFGGIVSQRFTWPRSYPSSGLTVPTPLTSAWLCMGAIGALAQFLMVGGVNLGRLGVIPAEIARGTAERAALFSQAEMLLVVLALIAYRFRQQWLTLTASGLALALAAASGHPGETQSWWALPANIVHVLAVGIWIGGLVHLVQVGFRLRSTGARAMLSQGTRRYAAIALWAVIAVISTGVLEGLAQVPSAGELLGSAYGRILLVKATIVGAALSLALAARLGALGVGRKPRVGMLRIITRLEAGVLLGVIGSAALLSSAAPPLPALAGAILPAPPLHGQVLQLAEFDGHNLVRVLADSQNLTVMVTGPEGKASSEAIDVRTILPSGDYIDLTPRACGNGCATGDYPWEAGITSVLVVTGRLGRAGSAGFNVSWPPAPADPARLKAATLLLQGKAEVAYTERTTTARGTSAAVDRVEPGRSLAARIGLGTATVRLLPQQQRADQLLLSMGDSAYYELDFSPDGQLIHELEVSPLGRVERSVH